MLSFEAEETVKLLSYHSSAIGLLDLSLNSVSVQTAPFEGFGFVIRMFENVESHTKDKRWNSG